MAIKITTSKISVPLKIYEQQWKIVYLDENNNEIVIGDNSATDINRVLSGSFTRRSLRYGLGDFNINLLNDNGYFNNLIKKATTIKVYADHTTSTPTNQIFDGRVDSIKHSLSTDNIFTMSIYGRSNPQLNDLHITKDFSNGAQANSAIKAVIDDFFSGVFTYNNISTTLTATIYGQYIDQPALSVIADILKQTGYDGYVDFNNDLNIFQEGVKQNSREKILYGNNMLEFSEIGEDFVDEMNRIICYGSGDEETLLLKTSNDTDLQNSSWIKSDIVSVGNLTSLQTVQQKADVELAFRKQTPKLGSLTASNGLPTLLPAQSIYCSCQFANFSGNFNIVNYTHNLSQDATWTTSVEINRLLKTIYADIISVNNKVNTITSQNINGMSNTVFLLKFDNTTQIQSLGDLKIQDSKLSINVGAQGTLTTIIEILTNNAISFEARAKANDDCGISYFQVSNDGGLSYNDANTQYSMIGDLNKKINFTTTGKLMVVKITLKSDSNNSKPELDSFTLLIK